MLALPSIWSLIIPLAIAALAAVVFLRWGLRRNGGQPIPPSCAKCGYDVSHRPPGVQTCSECGADLTRPGGVRVRKPRLRTPVAVPDAVALVAAAAVFAHVARQFPWRGWFADHGRIAWVEALARRDHSATGDLFRRAWERRDLSPSYYDHLLDLQADSAAPWDQVRAGKLAFAVQNVQLTDAQLLARWERQVFSSVTFAVRSPVRLGDPLFVRATASRGSASPLFQQVTLAIGKGGPVGSPGDRMNTLFHGVDVDYDFVVPPKIWQTPTTSLGKHRITLAATGRLSRFDGKREFKPIGPDVTVTGAADIDVVPATATAATALPDPGRADAVARAVDLHVYGPGILTVTVRLLPVNVDRAFTVYAVVNGERRALLQIAARRGETALRHQHIVWSAQTPVAAKKLTIIFAADPDALNDTLDQRTYWPGEITYDDVAVQPLSQRLGDFRLRPTPTTRPYHADPGGVSPIIPLP